MKPWFVYLVRCHDGSIYTGVTTNVERRVDEHNHNDRLGARYTRSRRPVVLVYQELLGSRAEACRLEAQIKAFTRSQKERLIETGRCDLPAASE